jgi:hypothetical protein
MQEAEEAAMWLTAEAAVPVTVVVVAVPAAEARRAPVAAAVPAAVLTLAAEAAEAEAAMRAQAEAASPSINTGMFRGRASPTAVLLETQPRAVDHTAAAAEEDLQPPIS